MRAQAPLRRVLARIAGRLVATKAWEPLGFARLSDWARERAGLSARSVYDLAHVDAALARLPRAEAAFVAGEISWSKLRLLCRVAEPADEARWLAFARRSPVHTLEREVRAVDRGSIEAGALGTETDEDGAFVWRRKTVEVRCTPWVRGRWHEARQLARRVAGEPLPPWACMEAVVAEVLSALPLAADAVLEENEATAGWDAGHAETHRPRAGSVLREASDAHAAGERDRVGRAGAPSSATGVFAVEEPDAGESPVPAPSPAADAAATDVAEAPPAPPQLPVFLRKLVAGLDEADAFALDARFRRGVALEQRLWAQAGTLLAMLACERDYLALGYRSVEAYARERLGISPRKARALLRLERAGELCPELREAYRDGRLSWVQALALVPIIVLEHSLPWRARWIAHATQITVRRLEEEVERALAFETFEPPDERQSCAKPRDAGGDASLGDDEDHDEHAAPSARAAETARFFFTGPRDVALLIEATICTVQRHIERQIGPLPTRGEAMDAMFEHVFETWRPRHRRVPREHRVFERDGWRCTAPGCSSYRNLHDHHVVFRSAGGSDELANRTTLCAWHHLRGVHAGLMRCLGEAPDTLVFELGVRPGRPPLVRYSAERRLA